MENLNIMLVGVGGQGTLLASRILGSVALKMNYDVKLSEVHGMAQRGGSVVTYVKMGSKVYSPVIDKGEADIILAFEQLEALRWIEYLRKDGSIIINTQKIDPMPVITGSQKYPSAIAEKIQQNYGKAVALDALGMAKECGNIKAVNVILIGVMAKTSGISKDIWLEALHDVVSQKLLDVNLKAFEAGYAAV